MQIYDPILWCAEAFTLFIAYTAQGAMWKGAQDHQGRGWVVALIWALATTIVLNGIRALHEAALPLP